MADRSLVKEPAADVPSAPPQKSRILIADDNPTNVELLEVYLADLPCETAVAVDGRDTLDKVVSFKPDLILLDIMMPKLSGFEVCKQLKDKPETRGIMILMVTALNELGDIERAVKAGTDDFLSKPVNKLELLKRVENMLKLRHVTDELAVPVDGTGLERAIDQARVDVEGHLPEAARGIEAHRDVTHTSLLTFAGRTRSCPPPPRSA